MYPESTIISEVPQILAEKVTGTVVVYPSPIDVDLLARLGPIGVDISGTFGVTLSNPDGIVVPASERILGYGSIVSYQFFSEDLALGDVVAACIDWQAVMVTRIQAAITAVRALNDSLPVMAQTVAVV